MTTIGEVGTEGQITIERELLDRLGVQPGWLALQRVVDGHIEVHFVPPEHNRSLKGILAPYTNVTVSPEEWHEAVERAWDESVRADWDGREG